MTRRCLPPIVALVMLLASLLSTETAEVWCRVVVDATIDADDDDGPYFTFHQSTDISQAGRYVKNADRSSSENISAKRSSVSAAPSDGSIVDEPTFSLPALGLSVIPGVLPRAAVFTMNVAYAVESRGPPAQSSRFIRPPPRAPPLS